MPGVHEFRRIRSRDQERRFVRRGSADPELVPAVGGHADLAGTHPPERRAGSFLDRIRPRTLLGRIHDLQGNGARQRPGAIRPVLSGRGAREDEQLHIQAGVHAIRGSSWLRHVQEPTSSKCYGDPSTGLAGTASGVASAPGWASAPGGTASGPGAAFGGPSLTLTDRAAWNIQ